MFSFTVAGVKCRVSAVKKSPRTSSQCRFYFYFLWDHWAHLGYFENRRLLKSVLGDVYSLANYTAVYEETYLIIIPSLRYSFFCVFFVSKGNFSDFITYTLYFLFVSCLRLWYTIRDWIYIHRYYCNNISGNFISLVCDRI